MKSVFQLLWMDLNWQVNIKVLDVDEPPVFSQPIYTFNVVEEHVVNNIGKVAARDPDKANKSIRYNAVQASKKEQMLKILHSGCYTDLLLSLSV